MICNRIEYTNFRNIEAAEAALAPGVNLFVGANAAGKTSALEGIYLFATGRSHRTVHERDFVREGADFAALKMEFTDSRRAQTLQLRYIPAAAQSGRTRRFCLKNGVPLPKLSEFIGAFRAVLFCPGHLAIVQAGPGERRSFLDGAISQIDPLYMADLQQYYAILVQRNKLLSDAFRKKCGFDETIELWSKQLAVYGEKIATRRDAYVKELREISADILRDMSGGRETLELTYKKPQSADEYFALLTANLEREAASGATLYGPHREDIEIKLGGKSAREFASQGQQRSVAVAMKLGEGELSRRENGEWPVFLLDDILSELDRDRQQFVLQGIRDRQVVLTGCDESIRSMLGSEAACFNVKAGKIG